MNSMQKITIREPKTMNGKITESAWFWHVFNGWVDFTESEISSATLAVMEVVSKAR